MKITIKSMLAPAALAILGTVLPPVAAAQQEQETAATAPRPAAGPTKDPGRFAAGRKRVGFFGGAGSTLGQTYLIVGGGLGYFVADGLEVGLDFEGWVLQSPNIWKLTPQVRYVLWQAGAIKPYVGGFYRWTWAGAPLEDINSYGGRFGIAYQQGRNFLAVGAVYERFDTDWAADRSHWYPEISLWISF